MIGFIQSDFSSFVGSGISIPLIMGTCGEGWIIELYHFFWKEEGGMKEMDFWVGNEQPYCLLYNMLSIYI